MSRPLAMRAMFLAVSGLAMLAGRPAPAAAITRDEALARAHEIRDRVSRGDIAPLWPQFTPRMQTVLKDSVSFAAQSASIHAQIGAVDSVLDEEISDQDTVLIVKTRCRFKNLPVPGILTLGFKPDGRIGMLLVRPDMSAPPAEFPSKFMDYQPKTRFELPFRGEWLVFWGGRTLGENQHVIIRPQRFAHDIVMVKDGRTHPDGSTALRDHYCYGQPILAPAAGVVVTTVDSLPDQPIGTRDGSHAAGNHVVIDHGNNEYSLLAHLQPHSLKVKPGQRVKSGDVLGLTGNSGNTSEPHLHVHLMNKPSMDAPDCDGLPMPFSDYVLDGKVVERGEVKRFQLVKRHER